jgi:nucleoside-diphosphate-sugar epimerase
VRIAVAGGTSPLAKDVLAELSKNGYRCFVFSRKPNEDQFPYWQLQDTNFDAYLNLIGGHKGLVTQKDFDHAYMIGLQMATVATSVNAPLVHLSSGSVLRNDNCALRSDALLVTHPYLNHYQALKVNFELLHKSMRDKGPISDLRLFSFAGASAIKTESYFLSQLYRSIIRGEDFKLEGVSFLRDYSSPQEISLAISICFEKKLSVSANLFTSKPSSREEIIQYCQDSWGLRISEKKGILQSPQLYYSRIDDNLPDFYPSTSIGNVQSALTAALS